MKQNLPWSQWAKHQGHCDSTYELSMHWLSLHLKTSTLHNKPSRHSVRYVLVKFHGQHGLQILYEKHKNAIHGVTWPATISDHSFINRIKITIKYN